MARHRTTLDGTPWTRNGLSHSATHSQISKTDEPDETAPDWSQFGFRPAVEPAAKWHDEGVGL